MGIGVCLENNNCFNFRVNLKVLKIKEEFVLVVKFGDTVDFDG